MNKLLAITLMLAVSCVSCQDKDAREDRGDARFTSRAIVTSKSKACLKCHTKKQPSIAIQWRNSSHAEAGVGCYECHQAEPGDPDAIEHYDEIIAGIVSPKDCARCHETEAEQFLASHHAKGGEVLGSLDN